VFLSVNEESRRCTHAKILRSTLHRSSHIIEKLLVRQASLEGLLCKTGKFCNLQESRFAVLGGRPLLLLLEENVDHREVPVFRCAARQHESGSRARIERELTEDEPCLARIDIFF